MGTNILFGIGGGFEFISAFELFFALLLVHSSKGLGRARVQVGGSISSLTTLFSPEECSACSTQALKLPTFQPSWDVCQGEPCLSLRRQSPYPASNNSSENVNLLSLAKPFDELRIKLINC